jgi:hypothetical protein
MAEFEDSQANCARYWKRINVHGIDISICLADCARYWKRINVHGIDINMCLADCARHLKRDQKRICLWHWDQHVLSEYIVQDIWKGIFMHGIDINVCVANCARLWCQHMFGQSKPTPTSAPSSACLLWLNYCAWISTELNIWFHLGKSICSGAQYVILHRKIGWRKSNICRFRSGASA